MISTAMDGIYQTSGRFGKKISKVKLNPTQQVPYWLYLLECEGDRLYAGIALDVEQRYFQHVFGMGAKFTRGFTPKRVVAARQYANKGDALRAELQLKALPRAKKIAFFEDLPPGEACDCDTRQSLS